MASKKLVGLGLLRRNAPALAVLSLCTIPLAILSWRCIPFYPDDGFISLRYSQRLASGQGLTWTDGERVEGYSNFLWVVVMGVVGVFTRSLVGPSRVVGLACMAGALGSIVYAHRPTRVADALPSLVAGLFVVLTSEVQAWAIGGLEPALLAGLVAASTACAYELVDSPHPSRRHVSTLGVLLGLTSLTRPDGVLFTASTAAGILLARRDRRCPTQRTRNSRSTKFDFGKDGTTSQVRSPTFTRCSSPQ